MTTALTFNQIESLWVNNGGDPAWAPTMAAIAYFESGGHTDSLNNNPSTGDYSVGLWQINYFNGLLAPRTAKYGSPSALQADPNAQAKAAIDLLGGGAGITNWKGDTAGNLAQNGQPLSLASAQKLVGSFGTDAVAPGALGFVNWTPTPIGGTLGAVGSAGASLIHAFSWADALGTLLSDLISAQWWKRVGLFSVGVVLVIGGIVLFVSTTKTGQTVESDAALAAVA